MNIYIPNWKTFGIEDLSESLTLLGHHCIISKTEPKNYRNDAEYEEKLSMKLKQENAELVFSFNYYPVISKVCKELKLPYISWCYDNPLILTYSHTITNSCNHIFLFDTSMVEEIKALGATHVYYMPLAVNTNRIDKLQVNQSQKKIISADVSFVGRMYTEKHNLYDRITNLDQYTKGYLDGIIVSALQ